MYSQIGYFVFSDVRRLAKAYTEIKGGANSAKDIRTKIATIFTNAQLDPLKTKHYTFTAQRMMSLNSVTSGSEIDKALMIFVGMLLSTCGRAPALPPRLGFRIDPSVSPAEAVWLVAMSYVDVNKFKTYLPPVTIAITAADISDAVYYMTKDFEKWESMIAVLNPRMSTYVSHIKFKIKMGIPIDSFEKSVYMHCAHPLYGVEIDFMKPVAKMTLAEQVSPVESGDPLISLFAERLKQATLPGPKFSFIPLISNGAPEALYATYGPYPVKAVTSAGWIAAYDPYYALDLKPMSAPINITPEEHLLGLMASGTLSKTSKVGALALGREDDKVADCFKWNYQATIIRRTAVCSRNGSYTEEIPIPIILDIPEVDLIWYRDKPTLKFNSELLGRTVITVEPDGILFELARKSKQYGGNNAFKSSIDEFQLADVQDVLSNIVQAEELKTEVVYYSLAKGAPEQKTIDLRPFFAQYGDKIVRPAFSSFCNPPLHLLEVPQPSALDYVCQTAGLNQYERLMSSRAITICYNAFLLQTFFNRLPDTGTPAKTGESLDVIAYAKTALFRKV